MQLTNISLLQLFDTETRKLICSLLRHDAMAGRSPNFPELFATIGVYCSRYMLPGNHLFLGSRFFLKNIFLKLS